MIEYLLIKDMVTGRSLQVLREPPDTHYTVIEDSIELADVRKQSIGKIIRDWMRKKHD